jgi:para-aminobenzoate synthetase component 1
VTLQQIFRAIFPGGSITGAPKVRAMQIIEDLEEHRRGIYCGSIVFLCGNGDFDSNIAIRTLLRRNNEIHCWGGGGIVADSECDNEYQETLDKVGRLMAILEESFANR